MISSTTTTIHSTKYKTSYVYREEECGVTLDRSILNVIIGDKFDKKDVRVINLISDKPKVFVTLTTSFYHLYHDCIGEFLTQYELTPDAQFIIDITPISHIKNLPEYIKMFFKFLNSNKVDYRPIDLSKYNKLNINKFYYRNLAVESLAINDPIPKIYEFSQKYVVDKAVPATKKVFLSRKNFTGRDLEPLIKGKLPYQNDNRMDDEKLLQEYLKTLGFEIVVPEDFQTFEEQINYFYQTKMILSTTSSGFINACFMRPGSTMVELMTPLISFDRIGNGVTEPPSIAQQEIHHFYHALSLSMDHLFLSIPNKDRSAKKIIDIIESNSHIKNMLLEGGI